MKPIEITVKNATVKIYRRTRQKAGVAYPQFDVADYSTGHRKFISFADENKARRKAREIASALGGKKGSVITLDGAAASSYLRAMELLEPTGVPLEIAAGQFAQTHSILRGQPLQDAATFYAQHHSRATPDKSVPEVYDELLRTKSADGASMAYHRDLKSRLGKFAASFKCPIASIDEDLVNQWLRSLNCRPRGRNNYRRAVGTLLRFAADRGYISDNHVNMRRIPRVAEVHSDIEIFTPDEMKKLLRATLMKPEELPAGYNHRYVGPQLLALLILGGFAGLRTTEITRQRWSDVDSRPGYIRVSAAKGNTAQKRLVPILPNLREWFRLARGKSEHCCEYRRVEASILRLAKRAGVEWKHNGLRHSFISYRLAQTQNAAQVSLEAGNSPRMIFRHYRELVTPKQAEAWFDLLPTSLTERTSRSS